MSYTLPRVRLYLFAFAPFVSLVLFLFLTASARGAGSSVLISEVKVAGVNANDEFVELFNASDTPVNLKSWRLARKIASATSGATPDNLVASLSGTIAPHSFFLVAHPASTASSSADRLYSNSSNGLTANNTVFLFSDAGITVEDEVKMGASTDFDQNTVLTPVTGKSIERKACDTSTVDTMKIGGLDEFSGNGQDTDDNAGDFTLRDIPQPQNSASPAETSPCGSAPTPSPNGTPSPTPTVTPTATPTSTPAPSLEPTATPVPTIEPTNTPVPTATPTPSPSATSSPTPEITSSPTPTPIVTPTLTPSPSPTSTPTASPTSSPIPSPTPSPTPNPNPGRPDNYSFQIGQFTCDVTFHLEKYRKVKIWIPEVECHRTRETHPKWHWWWERDDR